jgi:hypothetical protein
LSEGGRGSLTWETEMKRSAISPCPFPFPRAGGEQGLLDLGNRNEEERDLSMSL